MDADLQVLTDRLAAVETRLEEAIKSGETVVASRKELAAQLAEVMRERDAWKESAELESRNRDYYRGLVVAIGEQFGVAAKTADDGTIQDDVLCAKVPELVAALTDRLAAVEASALQSFREMNLAIRDLTAQLAEVTRQRESYERASLVLIQQLADRDRALAALRASIDIETLRVYHDRSFMDPPSYHEPDVESLWNCDRCVLKFADHLDALLAPPAPEARCPRCGQTPCVSAACTARVEDARANFPSRTDAPTP